jgi:TolA-binding protein
MSPLSRPNAGPGSSARPVAPAPRQSSIRPARRRHALVAALALGTLLHPPIIPPALAQSAPPAEADSTADLSVLEHARALFRDQQFADGEQLLQQFVRSQSNHADADEARFLIGRAQVRQERHDDARRSFEWIVNANPRSEWAARSLEQLALLAERSRNPSGAQDHRRRLLRDHPDSPTTATVWLGIADTHFRDQEYRQAAELYQRFETALDARQRSRLAVAEVLAGSATDPAVVLEHVVDSLRNNRIDTAQALARAVQRQFPRHPAAAEAALREGQTLIARGDRESAEQARDLFASVFNHTAATDEVTELARWELIRVNAGPLADIAEALKWCEIAINTSTRGEFRHQQAMYSKAWLLWAHRRFEPALEAFEEFAAAYPEQGASAPIQAYIEDCRLGEHRSVRRP